VKERDRGTHARRWLSQVVRPSSSPAQLVLGAGHLGKNVRLATHVGEAVALSRGVGPRVRQELRLSLLLQKQGGGCGKGRPQTSSTTERKDPEASPARRGLTTLWQRMERGSKLTYTHASRTKQPRQQATQPQKRGSARLRQFSHRVLKHKGHPPQTTLRRGRNRAQSFARGFAPTKAPRPFTTLSVSLP
jgi:hypothetical protein